MRALVGVGIVVFGFYVMPPFIAAGITGVFLVWVGFRVLQGSKLTQPVVLPSDERAQPAVPPTDERAHLAAPPSEQARAIGISDAQLDAIREHSSALVVAGMPARVCPECWRAVINEIARCPYCAAEFATCVAQSSQEEDRLTPIEDIGDETYCDTCGDSFAGIYSLCPKCGGTDMGVITAEEAQQTERELRARRDGQRQAEAAKRLSHAIEREREFRTGRQAPVSAAENCAEGLRYERLGRSYPGREPAQEPRCLCDQMWRAFKIAVVARKNTTRGRAAAQAHSEASNPHLFYLPPNVKVCPFCGDAVGDKYSADELARERASWLVRKRDWEEFRRYYPAEARKREDQEAKFEEQLRDDAHDLYEQTLAAWKAIQAAEGNESAN